MFQLPTFPVSGSNGYSIFDKGPFTATVRQGDPWRNHDRTRCASTTLRKRYLPVWMSTFSIIALLMIFFLLFQQKANAQGDPENGSRLFRACVSCHSLKPGDHRTGPSLSGIWGRKAGSIEEFPRYSPAMKKSDVTWNKQSMDKWLEDPSHFMPENWMTFPGIKNDADRAALVAYLQKTTGKDSGLISNSRNMVASDIPDLKTLGLNHQVTAIRYCRDTYHVSTKSGKTLIYWEYNLRLKTDSSDRGPTKDHPVIVPSGMRGDRGSIVFSAPQEIGRHIQTHCDD